MTVGNGKDRCQEEMFANVTHGCSLIYWNPKIYLILTKFVESLGPPGLCVVL